MTAGQVRVGRGIAAAAGLIALVTAGARLAGFGRQLVFTHVVRQTGLGTVYTTANSVPNIVFEIVAGGALASLVVPVLAGPAAAGDRETAGRTASALLSWAVAVLVPVSVLAALVVRPVMGLLLGRAGHEAAALAVGSRMLLVFLPQLPLYGIAVVSAGILAAHRRFLAAAVAPLVSSAVVAAAYVGFGLVFTGDENRLATLDRRSELILSGGTTLGVLALCLCTAVPLAGAGLALRPALRFPPGVAGQVRRLALAGIATVAAQQVSATVVVLLVNDRGGRGRLVTYQNGWMVYLLPYAVLALPIATSAFPRLSQQIYDGDTAAFAATTARTTRLLLLAAWAGGAVLAATALPVSRFFAQLSDGGPPAAELGRALLAFAPGVVGYALVAHLGRALYAAGRRREAAAGTVAGWLTVIVADLLLGSVAPPGWVVAAMAAGNSIGMIVAGLLLVVQLRRCAGAAAVRGVARSGLGGLLAAGCAAGAATALASVLTPRGPGHGMPGTVAAGIAVAVVALAGYTALALLVDGAGLRLAFKERFSRG